MREKWTLVVVLLAVIGLAGGCASIPDQSQAQAVTNAPQRDNSRLIGGPDPDIDQYALVRGFIKANAQADDDFKVARSYLTDSARNRWKPKAQVTVIGDQPDTRPSQTRVENPSDESTVLLRGDDVGQLQKDGSFVADGSNDQYKQYFTVRRERGQWRIDALEDGLVLERSDFQRLFQQVDLSFPAPRFGAPVTDVRYLQRGTNGQIATNIVSALLQGPSASLVGTVDTAFNSTMHNATTADQERPDLFVVNLTNVGQPNTATRKEMIDQIVRSLHGVVGGPIEIQADGAPLDPEQKRWQYNDLSVYSEVFQPSTEAKPLYVAQGTVRALAPDDPSVVGVTSNDTAKALSTMNGLSDCQATSGARSLDGDQLAVVCQKSAKQQQLRVGKFGQGVVAQSVTGKTLTRPSFAPGGGSTKVPYELWTVADGAKATVLTSNGSSWSAKAVDSKGLSSYGRISDFRVSRDGTRAAVVAGGKLVMVKITRQGNTISLVDAHQLVPDITDVRSVDWRVSTELIIIHGERSRSISTISADGLYETAQSVLNLSAPLGVIAAAPGSPPLVADSSGIFRLGQSGSTWSPLGGTALGAGAVPFYAG